ncbi:leucyl aminopeptidase [Rhodobacteraceae bacterium 2CG4]|uniref:Probable cytosol aminopeptidase n=1 Tax=Halovulum marinum TaxID=2662447 RepID=A0A6L5Z1D8_9RHOB|nr:leucyl aminopeptidase [Halovulum marinum]MSU89875.1 leucyl aminopeptidase [Halovulum marinum]
MSNPPTFDFAEPALDAMAQAEGTVAVLVAPDGKLDRAARRADKLTRGAVSRMLADTSWARLDAGRAQTLAWPAGLAASRLVVVKLSHTDAEATGQLAGAAIAKAAAAGAPVQIHAARPRTAVRIALGFALRAYGFERHRTSETDGLPGPVTLLTTQPDQAGAEAEAQLAVARGVHFARDLVNEPANVLTTTEFATRLEGLRDLGVEVEVLDEPRLEELGMRTLLAVGQGSRSPSRVVVMEWRGGGDAPPFALVGKGVVFDTGGISLKPGPGMEEMTMDMGGAGVVAGAMAALAGRKAKANVVGLVGLVENMPDGNAQRPGDVVRSMKGDTIEVLNTDAEGRLVLADVLWYAQERFRPSGIVDLATLTGAIIIGLGHHRAGVFSNDDALASDLLKAAAAEGEGAWRMPLGPEYDKQLKSRIADIANIGGRPAGAVTAAQFLQRFVKDGQPWVHLDIAGVAALKEETDFAPKGATGWGVRTLNRLIADGYETG